MAKAPKGWFSSSFISRGTRPKDLRFQPGQTFEMQRMTATIEEVTEDGRPLSVRFSFAEDLSQFDWLGWGFKGPRRVAVPALGGEVQVSALQRE